MPSSWCQESQQYRQLWSLLRLHSDLLTSSVLGAATQIVKLEEEPAAINIDSVDIQGKEGDNGMPA